jgi:hypothetical protein
MAGKSALPSYQIRGGRNIEGSVRGIGTATNAPEITAAAAVHDGAGGKAVALPGIESGGRAEQRASQSHRQALPSGEPVIGGLAAPMRFRVANRALCGMIQTDYEIATLSLLMPAVATASQKRPCTRPASIV